MFPPLKQIEVNGKDFPPLGIQSVERFPKLKFGLNMHAAAAACGGGEWGSIPELDFHRTTLKTFVSSAYLFDCRKFAHWK